jgi:hypothetical protein
MSKSNSKSKSSKSSRSLYSFNSLNLKTTKKNDNNNNKSRKLLKGLKKGFNNVLSRFSLKKHPKIYYEPIDYKQAINIVQNDSKNPDLLKAIDKAIKHVKKENTRKSKTRNNFPFIKH